jgi:sugar phosphate isomerase/epimerase
MTRKQSRALGLAYLTIPDQPPPIAIATAAALGCANVGLRLLPAAPGGPFWPLASDAAMLRDTRAAIKDHGVAVFDLEVLWLGADFDVKSLEPFFSVAAELGAKAVLVAGTDPERARLIQSYATFCDAARPFGLTADLEFMPWTKVPNAKVALDIVQTANRPNGGILVDALHLARSGSTLDDIRAIPRELLHYVQICDAPAAIPTTIEGLLHTARRERLLPGEGDINLRDLFAALPHDLPVSLEIPNDVRIGTIGSREWARQAIAATLQVLDSLNPKSAV